jgi:predicted secreted protein
MRPAHLLAALLTVAPPALAQTPPPSASLAETVLHLGESAEVTRAPDEIVATLRAEARAGGAAAAQEAVNRAVAAAVARAGAVPGVRVSTGGYWTSRVEEGRQWQAAQTLTLRGGDAAAMLELAGALQGAGLATAGLTWTLRRETARTAREEASRLALDALRRRAEEVAAQLGMTVAGLREVRIDAPDMAPRPMVAMAARSERAAAPPVALAEDAVISARVEAVAVLRPR